MQTIATSGGLAMKAARALRFLGGISILFSCLNASAGLVAYWQMGEADFGAAPGGIPTGSQDSSGNGLHLLPNFSSHYTSFVAPGTGSTLAIGMTRGGLYRALVTDQVDNFAIDLWAAASSDVGIRAVVYNGDTALRGWGIYQVDDDWQILYGGVIMSSFNAPVALLQYQHLQFSRVNGVGSFYVDGLLVGQLFDTPNAPIFGVDATLIGVRQGGDAEHFDGNLDEIRISIPEPTSTALLGLGILGLAAFRRKKGLA